LDIRHRGGKDGASVGFFTDIANEPLDYFAFDPLVLDFGQVDFIAFCAFTNKAHVVSNILTTTLSVQLFSEKTNIENHPVKSLDYNAEALSANCSEHF
jgi:hypothetical protein